MLLVGSFYIRSRQAQGCSSHLLHCTARPNDVSGSVLLVTTHVHLQLLSLFAGCEITRAIISFYLPASVRTCYTETQEPVNLPAAKSCKSEMVNFLLCLSLFRQF